jgi:hypothetical protein
MLSTLRLSEAIRLGAMMKPPARGVMGGAGGTCAIGAAADAIGHLHDREFRNAWDAFSQVWPILGVQTFGPSDTWTGRRKVKFHVRSIILSLNDDDGWTREQIADWVESIERSQEQCNAVENTSTSGAVA